MVKYSAKPDNETLTAKARGSHLRAHFKKCREVGAAIAGKKVLDAQKYLEDVIAHKAGVPFKRFTGGGGRHAMAKQVNAPGSVIGWPEKAARYMLDLLTNVVANAEVKGLKPENLTITHLQVNQAPKMRRRTYRAHGRINAFMRCPSHIELFVSDTTQKVDRPDDKPAPKKLSRKRLSVLRLKSGGGVSA